MKSWVERGDVPLLNNYPMELGSEEKWLNINITQIGVFFNELEEKMQ
jgi:hypothetical protein